MCEPSFRRAASHQEEGPEAHEGQRAAQPSREAGQVAPQQEHREAEHRGDEQPDVDRQYPPTFGPATGQRARATASREPACTTRRTGTLPDGHGQAGGQAHVVRLGAHERPHEARRMVRHRLQGQLPHRDRPGSVGEVHDLGVVLEHPSPAVGHLVPARVADGQAVDHEHGVAGEVGGVAPGDRRRGDVEPHGEHHRTHSEAQDRPRPLGPGEPDGNDQQHGHRAGPDSHCDRQEDQAGREEPRLAVAEGDPQDGGGQGSEGHAQSLRVGGGDEHADEAEDAGEQDQCDGKPQVTGHHPAEQAAGHAQEHRLQDQRQPEVEVGQGQLDGHDRPVQRPLGGVVVEGAVEQQPPGPAEPQGAVAVGDEPGDRRARHLRRRPGAAGPRPEQGDQEGEDAAGHRRRKGEEAEPLPAGCCRGWRRPFCSRFYRLQPRLARAENGQCRRPRRQHVQQECHPRRHPIARRNPATCHSASTNTATTATAAATAAATTPTAAPARAGFRTRVSGEGPAAATTPGRPGSRRPASPTGR